MMKRQQTLTTALALVLLLTLTVSLTLAQGPGPQGELAPQDALGTGFTYQGRLTDADGPIDDSCNLRFKLYDQSGSGGTQIGPDAIRTVTITDGYLTVTDLDFGADAFTGEARWLEIAVRCPAGSGDYVTLEPRQLLTPAPYALALPGLWTQQNDTSPNLIGGYSDNSVTEGVEGAVIGGGGLSGYVNRVTDGYSVVGGGGDNQAGDNVDPTDSAGAATVGGGWGNTAAAVLSTIGGGYNNVVRGDSGTVGGGNSNAATGYAATVGGGAGNLASGHGAIIAGGGGWDEGSSSLITNTASADWSAIGGGRDNTASGEASTIGGGWFNTIGVGVAHTVGGGENNTASGEGYATVGGGFRNTASGGAATVPGGEQNTAEGYHSFAAGRRAYAANDGTFVWADSNDYPFLSNNTDQFSARATGGTRFVLAIDGSGLPTWECGVMSGGTWACSSARDLKENLVLVDGAETLERLSRVPIFTWNARGQDPPIRHIGPMAQDFYAAFEVGQDERHIATIDLDGVALAAIQGLYQHSQEQAIHIEELEIQNVAQQKRIDNLETRLMALETASSQSLQSGALGLSKGSFLTGGVALLTGLGLLWAVQRRGILNRVVRLLDSNVC